MTEIPKSNLDMDLLTFLTEGSNGIIFPSKGEAKRTLDGGGLSINKRKIESVDQMLDFDLLQGKYLLVQKGKKNYFLLQVT